MDKPGAGDKGTSTAEAGNLTGAPNLSQSVLESMMDPLGQSVFTYSALISTCEKNKVALGEPWAPEATREGRERLRHGRL